MAAKPDSTTNPNPSALPNRPIDALAIARYEIESIVDWTRDFNGLCPVCHSAIMIAPREDCLCHPCESLHNQLNTIANQEYGANGYYSHSWGVDDQWWHPFIPATVAIEHHAFSDNPTIDDLKWVVGEVYDWTFFAERVWDALDKLANGNWGWKSTEFPRPVLISGTQDYDWIELELDRTTAVARVVRWAVASTTDKATISSVFSLLDWAAQSFSAADNYLAQHMTEEVINYNEMTGCSWFDDTTRHVVRWMPYDRYLKTFHWQVKREDALDHAGGRCQVCNAANSLQVHHRTYERRGAELPEDLIVLCRSCHETFHKNGRLAR
jgi:hypothetical protein